LNRTSKSAVFCHCQPDRTAAMRADQSDQHGAQDATQPCSYSTGQSCQHYQHWQWSYTHHSRKHSNISRLIANTLRLFTADYILPWSIYRPTTLLPRDLSQEYLCNSRHQIRGQGRNNVTKRHSSDTGCCLSFIVS
jgi:hypothetical protein